MSLWREGICQIHPRGQAWERKRRYGRRGRNTSSIFQEHLELSWKGASDERSVLLRQPHSREATTGRKRGQEKIFISTGTQSRHYIKGKLFAFGKQVVLVQQNPAIRLNALGITHWWPLCCSSWIMSTYGHTKHSLNNNFRPVWGCRFCSHPWKIWALSHIITGSLRCNWLKAPLLLSNTPSGLNFMIQVLRTRWSEILIDIMSSWKMESWLHTWRSPLSEFCLWVWWKDRSARERKSFSFPVIFYWFTSYNAVQ